MRFKPMTNVLFATLIMFPSVLEAQINRADEAALHHIVTDLEGAWANCDAKALAALWTEDGDFLSPCGTLAKGRAEIERFYADAFSSGYCHSTATGTVSNIRFVEQDIAIVDGTWDIKGAHDPQGLAAPEEKGRFTAVAKKLGARWFIMAQREMIPAKP
jgi:uncharacterized protein (TIGR02246 family)